MYLLKLDAISCYTNTEWHILYGTTEAMTCRKYNVTVCHCKCSRRIWEHQHCFGDNVIAMKVTDPGKQAGVESRRTCFLYLGN
jgi:hypothetical protein